MTVRRRCAHTTAIAVAVAVASFAAASVLAPAAASAHDLRPALLSITETAAERYEVLFRLPLETAVSQSPTPVFPMGSESGDARAFARVGDMAEQRFQVRVPGGLPGRPVTVRFVGAANEVLIRVAMRDGRTSTGRIIPTRGGEVAAWLVPAAPTARAVAATYLKLGVEHILSGIDHLAFVLGLVLLTPGWRTLWKSITAFTAAHSLTLALAALAIVRVPLPPVEAAIALSIVFVAREVMLAARGRPGLASRHPWPIAFVFGLLHGLGFAGALAEVGLPESDIPLALFAFNAGVEVGQLVFVAAALFFARALARVPVARLRAVRLAPGYLIGTLATFWCLQRVARFWS